MLIEFITDFKIKNRLFVAPMAGITDLPFRRRCLEQGAALSFSEMVLANQQVWAKDLTLQRSLSKHEGINAIQIVGSDPSEMSQLAQQAVHCGAEIIDINMGCPAKKVNKKRAGSALMQLPELVREILKEVVNAVKVPVTLKIRTGWDLEHKNGVEIAQIAEDCGVKMITVHGRTRACLFKGDIDYDSIQAIKRTVSIPVVANGDITTPKQAQKMLERTDADFLMIGRGAQGKPWIFDEIQEYLRNGNVLPLKESDFIAPFVLAHIQDIHRFYGECLGAKIACKHVFWYSQHYVKGEQFRRFFGQIKQADDQLEAIEAFFKHNLTKSL